MCGAHNQSMSNSLLSSQFAECVGRETSFSLESKQVIHFFNIGAFGRFISESLAITKGGVGSGEFRRGGHKETRHPDY